MVRTTLLSCTLALVGACSSSTAPPLVASGSHTPVGGGGPPAHDAGEDVTSTPVTTDGGPTQNVSCTYTVAGALGVVCAIEVAVPAAGVATYASACTSPSFDGTPGTTCTPDSLSGCCTFAATPTTSFSAASVVCYYPGDTADETSCQAAGGAWSPTQP